MLEQALEATRQPMHIDGTAYGFCAICHAPRGSKMVQTAETEFMLWGGCSANHDHEGW